MVYQIIILFPINWSLEEMKPKEEEFSKEKMKNYNSKEEDLEEEDEKQEIEEKQEIRLLIRLHIFYLILLINL